MVPELDILERYISGELNSSEVKEIEQMMADDPMLADAVEGLKEVGDMSIARASIARLYRSNKERVSFRTSRREQLSKRRSRATVQDQMPLFMGIAAGLAILLVSIFLIRKLNQSEPTKAQNNLIAEADVSEPGSLEEMIPELDAKSETEEEGLSKDREPTIARNIPTTEKQEQKEMSAPSSIIIQEMPEHLSESLSDHSSSGLHLYSSEPDKQVIESNESDLADRARTASTLPSTTPIFPSSVDEMVVNEDEEEARQEVVPVQVSGNLNQSTNAPNNSSRNLIRQKNEIEPYLDSENIPLDGETVISDSFTMDTPPKISKRDSSWVAYYQKSQRMTAQDNRRAQLFKVQAITEILYEGINAYRNERYQIAREKFQEVLRSSPNHVLAHHYKGLVEFSEEEFRMAVFHFRHNLDYPKTDPYEESRWYLAQSYLGLGKKRVAKKLLTEISASTSPFKLEAIIELKQMK